MRWRRVLLVSTALFVTAAPAWSQSGSPAAASAAAEPDMGPTAWLKDPRFKAAYYRALGPKVKANWLAQLDGPAGPLKVVKIDGTDYMLASVCKAHDCANNNTILLYAGGSGPVFGKIQQHGAMTVIGAPPPAVALELNKLWAAEWGRK
jgi:hypothetical protein